MYNKEVRKVCGDRQPMTPRRMPPPSAPTPTTRRQSSANAPPLQNPSVSCLTSSPPDQPPRQMRFSDRFLSRRFSPRLSHRPALACLLAIPTMSGSPLVRPDL